MASVTDIPDWCFVEVLGAAAMDLFSNPKDGGGGGGGFGAAVATPAQLAAMWSASPVRFVDTVACPTLVALGARDLRVPPSQGVEWHYALKARGVPTRLLIYPDDSHPIDRPASEADHWCNVVLWINAHLA